MDAPRLGDRPVYDPSIPFSVHTAEGEPLTVRARRGDREAPAFRESDLAWTYRQPLREAAEITDRVAFFNERVDLVVDGNLQERPVTPWSRRERSA